MNEYINIERVEYLVTKKCSGRCKHCSVITNDRNPDNSYGDFEKIIATTEYLLNNFPIKSIMTYGGEPLLYSEITAKIHKIGKKYGVEKRELITNGFFSKDENMIRYVVSMIIEAGVNEILLSMDAFHQERIPMKYVEIFISAIIALRFENIKIHPAWIVSQEFDNEYNYKTREIIKKIGKYNIEVSNGNIIVPSGLARENLKNYYVKEKIDLNKRCGEIKFTNSLMEVKNIRILPNGDIHICRGLSLGNIFKDGIEKILEGYNPYTNKVTSMLLDGGVTRLHQYAEENGRKINVDEYYSLCDLCADCVKAINSLS